MRFQTLMTIKAVVCIGLGLPILIAPAFTYSLFGTSIGAGGIFAAREYGAALIGTLLLTWLARNAVDSGPRRAIAIDLCVYDAIGFVVTLSAVLSGVLGPLGWLAAAIYLFFAIGFGLFVAPRKGPA